MCSPWPGVVLRLCQVHGAGHSAYYCAAGTQLERLVISLVDGNKTTNASDQDGLSLPVMTTLARSSGRPLSGDAANLQSPRHWGQIRQFNQETAYVPGTHWTVILDEIKQLKNMLSHEDTSNSRSTSSASALPLDTTESNVLFGGHKSLSSQEILAAVPSRSIADRLVAGYFLDRPIVTIVLHGPTFLLEYDGFWEDPLGTPMTWIGLLFSVMCLVLSYRPEAVPMISDSQELARIYREKIVQCLYLGKYSNGTPYSVETLLLYLHIELLRASDTQSEPWTMLGVVVRLAYRMGYHRDPSHFPNIPPFEGEMRRRVWSMLVRLDIQMSAQVGLPRMIREDQADVAEPRNLLDEDLHRDMQELPASRPAAVLTEIQYSLLESRLLSIRGGITDWMEAVTNRRTNLALAKANISRLDQQLDNAYAALPETLRMRPMAKSLVDNAETILRRMVLFLHLQESKCSLYYRFATLLPSFGIEEESQINHNSAHSIYIEAALHIIRCQRTLYDETQISGRLCKDRWKVSALLRNPCLMATSLLCSEIGAVHSGPVFNSSTNQFPQQSDDSPTSPKSQLNHLAPEKRAAIVQALHDSCLVWTHLSETSHEAFKVVEAVRSVLNAMPNTDMTMSPTVDNGPILDMTMNNVTMVPSGSVAGSPSRSMYSASSCH
ncbi:conserved hypothetical protein [Talaromyces stipitatus ATCC 10500]|uniref:Xylanolytic transcriptional activator regulatory domain-containing protein n=1 Tax=Talaromyces stipitatus (strain ATCC 10500 / CBS 375.48 / QM 6759 / NRRL 1006) TaxID=441959 RepID=B8LV37_TALSN|nr:uncharacterized protein TSTA_061470 [Talaromyces stipitatus ATCC 10500]XP_002340046.1 uncharacterized protein TSTA_061470 [Talaromyces stipitatus ATCC 10500]EED22658.1 conserved hypothetical protein [Talaromyces stipitatus ATCC 10500]EED22659.1 conserved hypothetical protein [Talaromyces stipitatus ATCC 10500]